MPFCLGWSLMEGKFVFGFGISLTVEYSNSSELMTADYPIATLYIFRRLYDTHSPGVTVSRGMSGCNSMDGSITLSGYL